MKQVQMIKTVDVDTPETLVVWLNQQLAELTSGNPRDGGQMRASIGTTALSLIHEAGFFLTRVDPNKEETD